MRRRILPRTTLLVRVVRGKNKIKIWLLPFWSLGKPLQNRLKERAFGIVSHNRIQGFKGCSASAQ